MCLSLTEPEKLFFISQLDEMDSVYFDKMYECNVKSIYTQTANKDERKKWRNNQRVTFRCVNLYVQKVSE